MKNISESNDKFTSQYANTVNSEGKSLHVEKNINLTNVSLTQCSNVQVNVIQANVDEIQQIPVKMRTFSKHGRCLIPRRALTMAIGCFGIIAVACVVPIVIYLMSRNNDGDLTTTGPLTTTAPKATTSTTRITANVSPSTTNTLTTSQTSTNPCISSSSQWSTTGITILDSTQISSVSDIFFDQNDTLYIADEYLNTVVWKLLRNAKTPILIAGEIQSPGSDSSHLNYPQGVHVDSKQNLYVSDYYNYRIQKYVGGSTSGETIAGISTSAGNALNQFAGLRHFWLDPTETYMYITDCGNNRIMRYLTNSTTGDNGVSVAGGNAGGNVNTQLNYPWGIHYLPAISNYLYITNSYGHSVMKWMPGDSSGIFLAGTPGVPGNSGALLYNPMGIKIDNYLNMFVVDSGNNRVLMFCNNSQIGTTIAGTGMGGSGATQLDGPRAIAFDSSMNMYISDHDNGRIQKFLKL